MAILAFILGIALFILSLPFSAVASANSIAIKISEKRTGITTSKKKKHIGFLGRTRLGRLVRGIGAKAEDDTEDDTDEDDRANKKNFKKVANGTVRVAGATKRVIFRGSRAICKGIAKLLRAISMALTGLGVISSLIVSLTIVAVLGGTVATIIATRDSATTQTSIKEGTSSEGTDTGTATWDFDFLNDVCKQMANQYAQTDYYKQHKSNVYSTGIDIKLKVNGKEFTTRPCCSGLVFGMLVSAGLINKTDLCKAGWGKASNWRQGGSVGKELEKIGKYVSVSSYKDLKVGDIMISKTHSHVEMYAGNLKKWNWGTHNGIVAAGVVNANEYKTSLSNYEVFRVDSAKITASAKADNNSSGNSSSGSGDGAKVISYAKTFVGKLPYKMGGSSLSTSCDCSHFVLEIYKHFGKDMYSTASAGATDGYLSTGVRKVGKEVKYSSKSDLKAGDIICYNGHVALYDGNGKIVEEQSSKAGCTDNRAWNCSTIITVRRVF